MVPTKQEIEEYLKAKAEKSAIDAKSRILEKKVKTFQEKFFKAIETHSPKSGELKAGGYRLWTGQGQVRPNWKDHYIEAKGDEAAAAIVASTPPSITLNVEPLPK